MLIFCHPVPDRSPGKSRGDLVLGKSRGWIPRFGLRLVPGGSELLYYLLNGQPVQIRALRLRDHFVRLFGWLSQTVMYVLNGETWNTLSVRGEGQELGDVVGIFNSVLSARTLGVWDAFRESQLSSKIRKRCTRARMCISAWDCLRLY